MPERLVDLLEFFERGGVVLWPILGLSVLMWALIVERYWYFFFAAPRLSAQLTAQWKQRAQRHSRYALRLRQGLVIDYASRLRQHLAPIRTLTVVLPLLGLFGTVAGMIKTFDAITLFGAGNVREMAAGISQALFTTMAGLLTALSGLYFSANLEARAADKTRRFETSLSGS